MRQRGGPGVGAGTTNGRSEEEGRVDHSDGAPLYFLRWKDDVSLHRVQGQLSTSRLQSVYQVLPFLKN